MANNFKVWTTDSGSSNLPDVASFNNENSDRGLGFRPNYAASSSFVNAGLRQANLFVTAFMQAMNDAGVDVDSLDFKSTVANLETAIQQYMKVYRHRIYFEVPSNNGAQYVTSKSYVMFDVYNHSSDKIIGTSSYSLNLLTWLRSNGYVDSGNPATYTQNMLPCFASMILNTAPSGQTPTYIKYDIYGIIADRTIVGNEIKLYYRPTEFSGDRLTWSSMTLSTIQSMTGTDLQEEVYEI